MAVVVTKNSIIQQICPYILIFVLIMNFQSIDSDNPFKTDYISNQEKHKNKIQNQGIMKKRKVNCWYQKCFYS